ncbi:MAG: TolC family protein, partial [Oceanicaulis sp.]
DAIDADQRLDARLDALAEAAEEAEAALELVERQYASGVATIFELIDAQTRLINADSQLIAARAARVDNRIGLHLAVAGDFEAGGGYAPPVED